jgi:hypothetical protein
MRIAHKHNLKNYLANKRIAVIQKGQRRLQTRIQFVNNRLVDKYILNYDNEIPDEVYDPFTKEVIAAEIAAHNRIATAKDLQRILKHSVVTRNPQTELEAAKVINNVQGTLTKIEAERVVKNLDYVGNVLEQANVDIKKYEALIEKLPQQTSRKEVLERCIVKGKELPPSKRQRWLEKNLERGASYNKEYSYKELNQLSRDLERYKTNRLDYETAIMENKQADREGYDRVNESKTWIWSTLEKTRHADMDGETVDLTSKFEVTNEVTGDVDYLLFPGDIDNDHNNCSNICNCGCSYEVNQA